MLGYEGRAHPRCLLKGAVASDSKKSFSFCRRLMRANGEKEREICNYRCRLRLRGRRRRSRFLRRLPLRRFSPPSVRPSGTQRAAEGAAAAASSDRPTERPFLFKTLSSVSIHRRRTKKEKLENSFLFATKYTNIQRIILLMFLLCHSKRLDEIDQIIPTENG